MDPCTNRKRIYCPYTASVELDAVTCDVESQESRCDNLDNDCDGATDESFPAKKNQLACDDGDVGACKRVGVYACNTTQNGVTCDFTFSHAGAVAASISGVNVNWKPSAAIETPLCSI